MIVQGVPVAEWVYAKAGGQINPATQAIGLQRDGRLVAGTVFDLWNGHNVFVHQRIDDATTRAYWEACARYIFDDLGCERATGYVAASNRKALSLNLKIGFVIEAKLQAAAHDGGELLVMVLWRDRCRILNWGAKHGHGLIECAECA